MPAAMRNNWTIALLTVAFLQGATAFQIPHAGHQHPLYVRYRQEHLERQSQSSCNARQGPHSQVPCPSDIIKTQGSAMAISEEEYMAAFFDHSPTITTTAVPVDLSISTPVTYDEETGMVQRAARAIVKSPVFTLVDNNLVQISSSLVLVTGALTEVAHCLEMELHHAAHTGSTEGLAILSLGHFFHYGREAIKQLIEITEEDPEDA
jgi:hypothetical protein